MANKEFIFIQGKTKWFRAGTPDPWGNYKHNIYPNPEGLDKLRALKERVNNIEGIKNTLRKDEDGEYMVFRRPQSKVMKGKVVGFAPPEVLMADGKTPLRDTLVGNGSDITTKLEVYTYPVPGGGRGRGARWLSSRIDNLVPFESSKDFDEGQERAVKGLSDQPEQLF